MALRRTVLGLAENIDWPGHVVKRQDALTRAADAIEKTLQVVEEQLIRQEQEPKEKPGKK